MPVAAQPLVADSVRADSVTGHDIVEKAKEFLGVPYRYGCMNPKKGFDCSGFTTYVYKSLDIQLTRTSRSQIKDGVRIEDRRDLQAGDLVFFVGTYDTPGVSHVGIYVGDNMMLHCGDPISYTNLNTSYWQSHFYAYGRPPYN